MKLKKRFPGLLLPNGKDKNATQNTQSEDNPFGFPEKPLYPHAGEWIAVVAIVIMLALLFIGVNGKAQALSKQSLKVGDQVPDITIDHIINYPAPTAKISDFKGKLLILDFWATWCAPCVAMIPKMDSVQKEFAGRVQFLPVAYQSSKEVLPFLDRLGALKDKDFKMPHLIGDTTLVKLFPHKSIPHFVWINGNGVVSAITELSAINSKEISDFLRAGQFGGQQKKEKPINYDVHKQLFPQSADDSLLITRSQFTGYIDGLGCGFFHNVNNPADKVKRITARNLTIPKLYQIALGRGRENIGWNRTILKVKDPSQFRNTASGQQYLDWLKAGHGYCYELVCADTTQRPFIAMEDDLQKTFPSYKATFDMEMVDVLVLERTQPTIMNASASETPAEIFDGTGCTLKNRPIADFTNYLDYYIMQSAMIPVVDESNLQHNVDMQLHADLGNVASLNKALKDYGLELIKAKRKLKMLVFSEL